MPLLRAEEITYTQVQQFEPERSIAFLSVSAIEVHGPHLPLGMDIFMSRWQAEETARRFAEQHPEWNVVVYPHLPLGTDELPLQGSINASQRTVYEALLSYGAGLSKAGFGYAVVTNGHGGARHAASIEAACRHASTRQPISMFSPSIATLHGIVSGLRHDQVEAELGRALTDKEREGLLHGEHAGTMETSFALVERPEQVDPRYERLEQDGPPSFTPVAVAARPLAPLISPTKEVAEDIVNSLARTVGWFLNTRFGYGRSYKVSYQGDPSAASAELGRALREVMVQGCLKYVERVTSGELAAEEVRSIASDPAIIQPGFWQRLGAGAAVTAIAGWWLARRLRPSGGTADTTKA